MKGQKRIKIILADLYYRGVTDGMDVSLGSDDRFCGNRDARQNWEIQVLTRAMNRIKKAVDSTPPATAERK